MTERLITVPLAQIRVHPDNPRIDAEADDELVDSIRTHGLIEPPLLAPDPELEDVWVLLDGHRRYDGAGRAGLSEITARVRDDLVTAAQQIEVMAITGLQKELLSPVEEARAYEQLVLLGMDEKAIAKSTGYSRDRVKQRLKLTGLTKEVQTAVHTGQATLTDVAALMEFADDPEATKELEEALGTDDFAYAVNRIRSRRERRARHAAIVEEFTQLGAKLHQALDPYRTLIAYDWRDSDLAERETHAAAGCLGYMDYGPDSYSEPVLVCLDPKSHAPAGSGAEVVDDADAAARREAETAARAEALERHNAAAQARLDWLYEHFTGLFPATGNTALAKTLAGILPAFVENAPVSAAAVLSALGGDDDGEGSCFDAIDAALSDLSVAKPPAVLRAYARLNAALVAEHLGQEIAAWRRDEDLATQLQTWDWLAVSGYPMSAVDREIHAALTAGLSESDTEGDAA